MASRARIALVAAVLAGGAVAGLVIGGGSDDPFASGSAPSSPLPADCLPLPGRLARPAWFPGDLPLPDGSYPSLLPEQQAPGVRQVVFTVGASLDGFVDFVLARWEEAGWTLGRGEREPGEAESVFYTEETDRYGQFRARAVYCDEAWTEVLLVMVLDGAPPAAPLIPSPSASPS